MDVVATFLNSARGVVRGIIPEIVASWKSPTKQAETKRDGSIVTATDKAVELQVTACLSSVLPTASVVGEESVSSRSDISSVDAASYYQQCLQHDYCVFLDPIDGTKNFASGAPTFCVSIGLTQRIPSGHVAVAGIVAVPIEGVMYSTDGVQVVCEDLASGVAEVVSVRAKSGTSIFANSTEHSWMQKNHLMLGGERISNGSSVYDLLHTCLGTHRAAVVGSQRMWDLAAPLAFGRALGLLWCDVLTGHEIVSLNASDFDTDLERRAWRLTRRAALISRDEPLEAIISSSKA